jgi:hypothetical protein
MVNFLPLARAAPFAASLAGTKKVAVFEAVVDMLKGFPIQAAVDGSKACKSSYFL